MLVTGRIWDVGNPQQGRDSGDHTDCCCLSSTLGESRTYEVAGGIQGNRSAS
jgi:hypothetical protein